MFFRDFMKASIVVMSGGAQRGKELKFEEVKVSLSSVTMEVGSRLGPFMIYRKGIGSTGYVVVD